MVTIHNLSNRVEPPYPPSITKITVLKCLLKNKAHFMKFFRVYIFWEYPEKTLNEISFS